MVNHVLVPIDGSDPSWMALDHAMERFPGDHITVVHVVDPAEGIYSGPEGGYYAADAYEIAVDRAETLCQKAIDRADDHDTSETAFIDTEILTGRPARMIIEYAEENDVDQIVMGCHGRSGISRILLGSVAETVVRRASMPVTVVR